MYSWEIEEYLKQRNYNITPLEFMAIINTSPQIKDVYFQGGDEYDKFKMCTDDEYNWNIRMQKEPKKLTLKKDNN